MLGNFIKCSAFYMILLMSSVMFGQAIFPLKVSDDGKYLVDAEDRPFFYHADTPWHLFFNLPLEDVSYYIERRKEQGFNALQIMLTGAKNQKDRYGESPFLGDHDFTRPNEKFFTRVDKILDLMAEHDMLAAIVPLWSGCCGGDMAGKDKEGNPLPMAVNGIEAIHWFGNWLMDRYGDRSNVLWIIGGDNDPFNAYGEYKALVAAMHAKESKQLFTYHAASTHSSTDVFPTADWLDVSMLYTYFRGFDKAWNKVQPDVYELAYLEHRKGKIPYFLGESTYEGEHGEWGSAQQVRKQAYWAALSGAVGHAYGSENWKLPNHWKAVLEYDGATSMKYLKQLMDDVGYHTLRPDWEGLLLSQGAGVFGENDFAVGAFANQGTSAIIYIPSARTIQIREGVFKKLDLRWFDPRTGKKSKVLEQGILETPSKGDWVLLVNL